MKLEHLMVMSLSCFIGLACTGEDDEHDEEAVATSGASGNVSGADGGDDAACVMTNPRGDRCDAGSDCSVACVCSDGVVTAGSCVNGSCLDADEVCEDTCENFDQGDYAGGYCAVGNGSADDGANDDGNDDGNDDSDDGADACMPAGDACQTNGDCCGFSNGTSTCTWFEDGLMVCADYCVLGADCSSGCCVPLEDGGGVCGPASFCG
jgi:hypothetical protein